MFGGNSDLWLYVVAVPTIIATLLLGYAGQLGCRCFEAPSAAGLRKGLAPTYEASQFRARHLLGILGPLCDFRCTISYIASSI